MTVVATTMDTTIVRGLESALTTTIPITIATV